MRCLPASKLPTAHGRCIHDWHAEVVALRAFNLFLIQECALLLEQGPESSLVVRHMQPSERSCASPRPFTIADDIRIHMYCSEAPCGDASMELTMQAQQDPTPWLDATALGASATMLGRGNFAKLGVVRRKPSRPDAPESLSKSCSDKLALKQCMSTLSSVTSLLVEPKRAYIEQLVLPATQYVPGACRRAFSPQGRLSPLVDQDGSLRSWDDGYAFRPFRVSTTSKDFTFSRRSDTRGAQTKASSLAAMWTPRHQEILTAGTVQGHKQMTLRGASAISRLQTWKAVVDVAMKAAVPAAPAAMTALLSSAYAELKSSDVLAARRKVKEEVTTEALQGWTKNGGDDEFGKS